MMKNNIRLYAISITIAFMALVGPIHLAYAQGNTTSTLASSKVFESDETMEYKLIFKWGIIRGKVGQAIVSNKMINSGQQYFTQILFRSVGIGDAFYSVRDTLETLYSNNRQPLRFEKRANENGYKMLDEISFKYTPSQVRASVKAYRNGDLRVDTIYTYDSRQYEVIDMLSALALVRGFDLSDPATAISGKKLVIPIGNSQAYTECVYLGSEMKRMPDGREVEVVKIRLDIQDKAFKTSKDSVTVWVTKDALQVPIEVAANLKIGRVVVELVSYHYKNR